MAAVGATISVISSLVDLTHLILEFSQKAQTVSMILEKAHMEGREVSPEEKAMVRKMLSDAFVYLDRVIENMEE